MARKKKSEEKEASVVIPDDAQMETPESEEVDSSSDEPGTQTLESEETDSSADAPNTETSEGEKKTKLVFKGFDDIALVEHYNAMLDIDGLDQESLDSINEVFIGIFASLGGSPKKLRRLGFTLPQIKDALAKIDPEYASCYGTHSSGSNDKLASGPRASLRILFGKMIDELAQQGYDHNALTANALAQRIEKETGKEISANSARGSFRRYLKSVGLPVLERGRRA
jgi:hypothetical protein